MSEYLEAAARIAERLCRTAIHDGGRCTWVGASMEYVGGNWRQTRRTFGGEPYAGTSGVALFLGQFHRFAPSAEVRRTALAALEQALERAAVDATLSRDALYTGSFGIGFAAAETGALLDDESTTARGLALIRSCLAANDETSFDVVAGYAGRIGALIRLHARFREPWMLEAATECGQRLLATAHRGPLGWSWGFGGTKYLAHDLTGYSHGTAGVGLALLELCAATSDDSFSQAASEAFRYERAWFSPQMQNWPDFRRMAGAKETDPFAYGYAWCHGAPGIGMSRLQAWRLTGHEDLRQEAEVAIRSCRDSGAAMAVSYSFGLCHGAAGNAELFLQHWELLGNAESLALAEALANKGIEDFDRAGRPWPSGLDETGEAPGLMLGLAGIGYFYLRMHGQRDVPSVLTIGS